jgi:hypothetical protein
MHRIAASLISFAFAATSLLGAFAALSAGAELRDTSLMILHGLGSLIVFSYIIRSRTPD